MLILCFTHKSSMSPGALLKKAQVNLVIEEASIDRFSHDRLAFANIS
jgi:hypothetical protein